MATVYLHAGCMKSGTTFLQYTLEQNRDLLASRGLDWHGLFETSMAVQDLKQAGMLLPGYEGSWRRFARRARASRNDTMLSMELLGPSAPRVVRRVAKSLAPHELRFVLTVRDITRVLPSRWQTATQNRGEESLSDFCAQVCSDLEAGHMKSRFWRHHDVVGLIEKWSAVVPRERMCIVTVPAARDAADDLWPRFARAVGVSPDGVEQATYRNTTLDVASADLLRKVNARTRDLEWPAYRNGVKKGIAKNALTDRTERTASPTLPTEHLAVLREWSQQLVKDIEASGVPVIGDLQDLVPPGDVGGLDPPATTTDELLEAALDGLVGMATQLHQVRTERDELAAQADRLARPAGRPGDAEGGPTPSRGPRAG